MCGRFVISKFPRDVARWFGTTGPVPNSRPRYNVSPCACVRLRYWRGTSREVAPKALLERGYHRGESSRSSSDDFILGNAVEPHKRRFDSPKLGDDVQELVAELL